MIDMISKNTDVHAMIVEQIKDVEACLINFESFMRAEANPATVAETLRSLFVVVDKSETAADASLRAMIDSLDGVAYLPSTKEDLINIATSCDKIANKCEHIAKVIVMQKIRLPEEFASDIVQILEITHKQFEVLEQCISMLFGKLNAFIKDHSALDNIRALESAVDDIEDKLTEKIFDMDAELAAKMQLARLIELICDLSDVIEDIADKIHIMLITRKA